MVPVATAQVGCVGVADGVTGEAGGAFIVTGNAVEIHPLAFFTVTL